MSYIIIIIKKSEPQKAEMTIRDIFQLTLLILSAMSGTIMLGTLSSISGRTIFEAL